MFVSESAVEHPPLYHTSSSGSVNTKATTFARRTESTRERDVFRYLRPWIDNFHNATLPRIVFSSETEAPPRTPVGCEDTALAAFAQLGAARLNAQRCLISLVSSSTEYILAESTKSLSLQHDVSHGENDGLWLGTSALAREEAVTNIAMEKWRRATKPREPPPSARHYYTEGQSTHWFIASDISCRQDLDTLPYLREASQLPLRFFCSVPIRSSTGSVVGSYSVLDERPRYGVSANEMDFLEDMANTITKHLEATVLSARQQRSERLIQGIGLFNTGEGTLRDWWVSEDEDKGHRGRSDDDNSAATKASRQDRANNEFGFDTTPEDFKRPPGRLKSNERTRDSPEGESQDSPEGESQLSIRSQITKSKSSASMTTKDNSIARNKLNEALATSTVQDFAGFDGPLGTGEKDEFQSKQASKDSIRQAQKTFERKKGPKKTGFDLEQEIKKTYDRASNLIREALGAEGALFLDASMSHVQEKKSSGVADTSSSITSSASDTDSDPAAPLSEDCPVLGFSTRAKSSLKGFQPSKKHLSLPKSFQARLMKRYPRGTIFNFAEDGSTYSSSGEDPSSSGDTQALASELIRKVRMSRSRSAKEGAALSEIFSGVRSVAFLPLWDASSQRFKAAALVWVTTPLRHFHPTEDMTYLHAFGNSIMAEMGRLDTIAADQAKATFISSVSHELRSPLHGILGGIEFLEGTNLDTFQQDMARAVKMAGITLLDTVNNILEFAKIDNRTQTPKYRRPDLERKSSNAVIGDGNSMIDLAKLTEDVIETVVTGRRFEAMATEFESSSWPQEPDVNSKLGTSTGHGAVSVSLVVPPRPHWWVRISPGSWTRVLTNLVGNSLKYTEEGFVHIEIKVGETVENTQDLEWRLLTLTIEDTGVGMSEEYLKTGLYTPFRQENSHSNGTGLGLSIVKMILEGMDGKITVTSKTGKGTKAEVKFLAGFVNEPPKTDLANDQMALALEAIGQQQIRLLTDGKSLGDNVSASRRDVLEISSTWFGKEPAVTPFLQAEPSGDLYMAIDSELNKEEERNPGYWRNLLHGSSKHQRHLVVLSSSIYTNAAVHAESYIGGPVAYINQPIGPRKLAKSFLRSMELTGTLTEELGQNTNPLHGHYSMESSFSPIRNRRSVNSSPLTTPSSAAPKPFGMGIKFASPVLSNDGSPKEYFTRRFESNAQEAIKLVDVPNAALSGKVVLLVDDNEINMKLLVALVKKLKLNYRCAHNGLVAVQEYTSNAESFYLVLMDMSMPVMDGFRATEEIRSHEKKNGLPRCTIVALTGVTSPGARKNAFSSGIDKFMAKPISMKQISLIVKEIREDQDVPVKE